MSRWAGRARAAGQCYPEHKSSGTQSIIFWCSARTINHWHEDDIHTPAPAPAPAPHLPQLRHVDGGPVPAGAGLRQRLQPRDLGGEAGQGGEHGRGRAIDISGFTLESGTTVSVLKGWRDRSTRKALQRMWKAACGPFRTVLGPDADIYHRDHFHLDVARHRSGRYCR